jgi:VanZ family protein
MTIVFTFVWSYESFSVLIACFRLQLQQQTLYMVIAIFTCNVIKLSLSPHQIFCMSYSYNQVCSPFQIPALLTTKIVVVISPSEFFMMFG